MFLDLVLSIIFAVSVGGPIGGFSECPPADDPKTAAAASQHTKSSKAVKQA
jgi:hypothetical protein